MIAYIKDLSARTARTGWEVAKVMVPVMLLVRLADLLGLTAMLGGWLAPVMGMVGLPGEAGLAWSIALLVGLYGGIGAVVALVGTVELTALQLNVLLSMILFAHGIPVEQAIVRRAGASFALTTLARVACAVVFGALLFHAGTVVDALQGPATLGLIPASRADATWWGWAGATLRTLVLMFAILFVLLLLIDVLKRVGLFDWLTRAWTPLLRRLGIAPPLAPLVTIGMLLGLTYGGGLIIEETRRGAYSARDLFAPLCALSVIHALIEDTVVVLALGADAWVIVVWRTLFAMLAIALIAATVRVWPQKAVAPAGKPL